MSQTFRPSRGKQVTFRGYPVIQSEFQGSKSYTERPCLGKQKKNKSKKPKRYTTKEETISKFIAIVIENVYCHIEKMESTQKSMKC